VPKGEGKVQGRYGATTVPVNHRYRLGCIRASAMPPYIGIFTGVPARMSGPSRMNMLLDRGSTTLPRQDIHLLNIAQRHDKNLP
jgi:hypothetical protein